MKKSALQIKLGETKILKVFQNAEIKDLNESERTLVVRISTASPDRSNDEMVPAGCDLTNYLKNPVVAAFHNYSKPAIAKTLDIQIDEGGIVAKLQFTPEGANPEADTLWKLYKDGFMNAWSIGFMPLEYTQKSEGGYVFTKWELLEYSAVLVPDNADALTMLRGKGMNVDELVEKDLDEVETKDGRVLSAKNRELIGTCVDTLKTSVKALQDLMDAAESGKSAEMIGEIVKSLSAEDKTKLKELLVDQQKEAEEAAKKAADEAKVKELESFVVNLRDTFRSTDKTVGQTLHSISKYFEKQKGGEK